ncbi:MAG TPA: HAMP domain-containing sensor histidine kinase [Xanthobacteraceae bacterium]|nr:HAMP domain-containing sensor histidine kinase [Xanthobacteraceae bacterium]
MSSAQIRSLQVRLAVRLAALYVVATAVAVAILFYQAYETADSLNDRELSLRAADLARHVVVDTDGAARVDLPPALAAGYEAAGEIDIFAIRGTTDKILAASPPAFAEIAAKWPEATDEPSYFHLKDFGSERQDYYGLTIRQSSLAGPISISVARAADADILVHSLLREFVFDVGWVFPLLVVVTVTVGVLAIRSAFKPITEVSQMAAAIGPGATSIRLPDKNLPSEITPLVAAVNRALGRLEQGFDVQRQFTANAAHELRTPLAIITAALDALEGNGDIAKIKSDVARMNRLVDQLLRVARLDAVALDISDDVDLNDVAAEIIAAMAPWSLARKRSIALHASDFPVTVKGNRYAIGDAIRNLVENAVTHSPPEDEVIVTTKVDRTVSVTDHGPGISPEHRKHVFERFWRGSGAGSPGAGLGLAIAMEIMRAHHGTITFDDNPGGGTTFTLRFPGSANA